MRAAGQVAAGTADTGGALMPQVVPALEIIIATNGYIVRGGYDIVNDRPREMCVFESFDNLVTYLRERLVKDA